MFQTRARAGDAKKMGVAPAQPQMLQRRWGATISRCHPRGEARTVPGASRCPMAGESSMESVNEAQGGEELVRQDLRWGRSLTNERA